uniref:Radical SAM superfamily protein n=1 Tax=viral metagenome TaxID=1070528 RepID=A0A6M3KKT7_9ZZZZ
MNSLTYLTRRCPRNCGYCNLVNSEGLGPELSCPDWVKAFAILKEIGVDFNLILGNETWLLGWDLISLMQTNRVPYALYTTCPTKLFLKWYDLMFKSGIDNLSCGIDYSQSHDGIDDTALKSIDGWRGIALTKKKYPHVDCQGTITLNKQNYRHLPNVVNQLQTLKAFCGINFIHWNKDGEYDFFPTSNELKEWMLDGSDIDKIQRIIDRDILPYPNTIQNLEMLNENVFQMAGMGWHCEGDPYGGPTTDSDGSLRCCGYRKGKRTPQISIFDLADPKMIEVWKDAVHIDAMKCPGCAWSYPWMYRYWQNEDPEFGNKVFINHAGKHIRNWSRRRVE